MTDLTLVIGNQNYSSWSLRPWLYLTHHDIPFQCRKISLSSETMGQDLAPYFSDGKVPLLLDGALQVWDSLAILEYLAERFPQYRGWPGVSEARAVARSACAEMHSGLFDLRNEMPMNCRRRFPGFRPGPGAKRDIDRVLAVWSYCRQYASGAGPWLFGDFSIVDCMYAPVVMRFLSYEIPLPALAETYCRTLYESGAMQQWIRSAEDEVEVIREDEVEWPSEPF